jgi:hypothetical protein
MHGNGDGHVALAVGGDAVKAAPGELGDKRPWPRSLVMRRLAH